MSDWKEHLNPQPKSKIKNPRNHRRKLWLNFDKKFDWRLDKDDFDRANDILHGELLQDINRESTFDALVFCQLAQRERYDLQVGLYRKLKLSGLLTPENVSKEKERWLKILRRDASLYKQKYRNITSAAEFWKTDYPDRLVYDVHNGRKIGEELREDLVENVVGIAYKTGSLYLLKMGYQQFISIDVWLQRFAVDQGLDKKIGVDMKETRDAISNSKYKLLENELREVAEVYGVTPAEFCAAVWGKYSKWSEKTKASYMRTVANHTSCDIKKI